MISRERDLQILHFLDSILCVCSDISNKIHPGDEIPDATRHKTRKKGAIGNYLQNDRKKTLINNTLRS